MKIKATKKELVAAIIEANECLKAGEGIDLLYFMESYVDDDKKHLVDVIKAIIGNSDG